MIQTRPISYVLSPDSVKAGTLIGASVALATSAGASPCSFEPPYSTQITIVQPTPSALNEQATIVEKELDALQSLWQSTEQAAPQLPSLTAVVMTREAKPFVWIDEPCELEDEVLFTPEDLGHFTTTYGEPVKMTFLPPVQGRFSPVEIDEVDLEIFDI